MVRIKLPGGEEKTFPVDRVPVAEVVEGLGGSWRRDAVAVRFGDSVLDLHQEMAGEGEFRVLRAEDADSLDVLRHSASHLLAYAVLELFPDARLAIGPPIDEGFYYDFDVDKPFTPEDLQRIEAKMGDLLATRREFKREVWEKPRAREFFSKKGQNYKLELIDDIPGDDVSIYHVGDFTDLCAGPHLEDTGRIRHFKVMNVAGAYWRGDSSKAMLQRIYATAFSRRRTLKITSSG